jgi:hypothetical protein
LAGRNGKLEKLLALGDPPEPAGVHFEPAADGLGPGFRQVGPRKNSRESDSLLSTSLQISRILRGLRTSIWGDACTKRGCNHSSSTPHDPG